MCGLWSGAGPPAVCYWFTYRQVRSMLVPSAYIFQCVCMCVLIHFFSIMFTMIIFMENAIVYILTNTNGASVRMVLFFKFFLRIHVCLYYTSIVAIIS